MATIALVAAAFSGPCRENSSLCPCAINICRVEKVNAGVEGVIDDGRRSRGVRSPSEFATSDADERDVKRPKLVIFHEVSLLLG